MSFPPPPFVRFAIVRLAAVAGIAFPGFAIAAPTGAAAAPAPIVIEGMPAIDLARCDGGLPPVNGAQAFEVFRASHAAPEFAEGKGYTYNHHPDLAVWHGRFYVGWDSGEKDEDTWPARELYSTSPDGRTWSEPSELFPEGTSTPTRLYFFHAPNGRMLAFAGLRIGHEKTDEDTKGPIIVREIRADHTLGPVFTARPPQPATGGIPPLYTTAGDADFEEACRQLLAARVTLETQDLGVFLDPAERMRWHDPAAWPSGKLGNGFWKAPSFFHRGDGALVGIGKAGWTSVSTDNGTTWSQPVVPPTLVTNNAKVWGQRTGDGRYALVYNPTRRPRYPLAIVTGTDGRVFGEMRAVQSRFPAQRYPGINKNPGLQYIRGIAEWATDRSVPDAEQALWLVYSANKEDIWVSRVPLAPEPSAQPTWTLYVPHWANAATTADGVTLASREPTEPVEAAWGFAPAAAVTARFDVTVPPVGDGAVDVELAGEGAAARAVRLRLCGDGYLRGYDRDKLVEFGRYAAGEKLAVVIRAHSGARGVYTVTVGGHAFKEAQFAEPASKLERWIVRGWARADADRAPDFSPAMSPVPADLDRPVAPVRTEVSGFRVETK